MLPHRRVEVGRNTVREKTEIVNDRRSLWTARTVYPPPDTHILRLPFSLVLPQSSLPTCEYDAHGHSCTIKYLLEVIGQRSGLRSDENILFTICVLPANSDGARLYDSLQLGWTGPMRSWTYQKMVRKGLWGDYSKVALRVSLG